MELTVICDELTALGWRLSGARVEVPRRDALENVWRTSLEEAQLVLITAGLAARLPAGELERAVTASRPLVRVIPDLRHQQEPPDPEDEVDRALGLKL